MAAIGSLSIDLIAEIAGFRKDLNTATKQMNSSTARMNKALAKSEQRAKAFRSTMQKLGATIGGAAMIRGIQRFGQTTLTALDRIGKTSSSVDVAAESLQEWRFAADQTGLSADELDKALQRLNRRVGEARAGEGEFAKVAEELGINLSSTEAAFLDLSDAIANASDSAEAGRIANDAFGRSGDQLINTLRVGRTGLQEYARAARRLGIIIDRDLIKAAEKANDQFSQLNLVISTNLQKGYMRSMIGETEELAELMKDPEFAESMETIGGLIGDISKFALSGAEHIARLSQSIKDLDSEAFTREVADNSVLGILYRMATGENLSDVMDGRGPTKIDVKRGRTLGSPQDLRPVPESPNVIAPGIDDALANWSSSGGSGSGRSGSRGMPPMLLDRMQDALDTEPMQRWIEMQREGAQVTRQFMTEQERHNSRMATYRELLDENAIGFDTFSRAVEGSFEQLRGMDEAGLRLSDTLAQFGDLTSSAFEDAILQGRELSSVLQALAEDAMQLVLRSFMQQAIGGLMGSVFNALSGSFGGGGFTAVDTRLPPGSSLAGARADGGPVSAGKPYLVGERGPEIVVPKMAGNVLPNMPTRAMGGGVTAPQIVNNVVVENHGSDEVKTEERENASGGRDLRVVIGEMVAGEMSKPGSAPDRVLQQMHGTRRSLIKR